MKMISKTLEMKKYYTCCISTKYNKNMTNDCSLKNIHIGKSFKSKHFPTIFKGTKWEI